MAFSLPSDKEQVMHVVADSANLSQKDHQGTYTGNVKFSQGTTNIHADNAITQVSLTNQLTLAIANGSKNQQAHYWSQTDPAKPPVHAYANSIRYHPLKHLIELIGNARVEQGDNVMSAAKITFDTLEQHVVTQGNKDMRTTLIIHPQKNQT